MIPAQARSYAIANGTPAVERKDLAPQRVRAYLVDSFPCPLFEDGLFEEIHTNHPYLVTWRVHAPDVWQQLAVIAFPYTDPQWREIMHQQFSMEGAAWLNWCRGVSADAAAPARRVPIAPLWRGFEREAAEVPGRPGVYVFGGHIVDDVPLLVRPYFPWPTLDERPMARSVVDKVRRTLPGERWGSVHDAFLISDGVHALPLWWSLADPSIRQPVRDVLTGKVRL